MLTVAVLISNVWRKKHYRVWSWWKNTHISCFEMWLGMICDRSENEKWPYFCWCYFCWAVNASSLVIWNFNQVRHTYMRLLDCAVSIFKSYDTKRNSYCVPLSCESSCVKKIQTKKKHRNCGKENLVVNSKCKVYSRNICLCRASEWISVQ